MSGFHKGPRTPAVAHHTTGSFTQSHRAVIGVPARPWKEEPHTRPFGTRPPRPQPVTGILGHPPASSPLSLPRPTTAPLFQVTHPSTSQLKPQPIRSQRALKGKHCMEPITADPVPDGRANNDNTCLVPTTAQARRQCTRPCQQAVTTTAAGGGNVSGEETRAERPGTEEQSSCCGNRKLKPGQGTRWW